MIRSIELRFGRSPGGSAEVIETAGVTVFVGPNNSGKSKILQELLQYARTGQKNTNNLLLEDVSFRPLSRDDAERRMATFRLSPLPGEMVPAGQWIFGKRGGRKHIPGDAMLSVLTNPDSDKPTFASWYLNLNTIMLDGQSRIGHVQTQSAGDLQGVAHTSFQVLFRDDAKRDEWRRIIYDAFGVYVVVDPTNLGTLRLRLSPKPPPPPRLSSAEFTMKQCNFMAKRSRSIMAVTGSRRSRA